MRRVPRRRLTFLSGGREDLAFEVETGGRQPTQPRHFDARRQAPEAASEEQCPRPILQIQIGWRSIKLDIECEIEQRRNIFDILNWYDPDPSEDAIDFANDLPLAFGQMPIFGHAANPAPFDLDGKASAFGFERYAAAVQFGNRRSDNRIACIRLGLGLAVVSNDNVSRGLDRGTNDGQVAHRLGF